jgi:hypothetical protein
MAIKLAKIREQGQEPERYNQEAVSHSLPLPVAELRTTACFFYPCSFFPDDHEFRFAIASTNDV